MSYEKIQTKGAYSDFTIKGDDIDANFDPLKEATGDWSLGLVNITNNSFSLASINYGKWFNIPKTDKNCETDYEECIGNGVWTVILAVPRESSPFSLRIATQPDQFGNATGTEFLKITPSTSHEGGIIGIG